MPFISNTLEFTNVHPQINTTMMAIKWYSQLQFLFIVRYSLKSQIDFQVISTTRLARYSGVAHIAKTLFGKRQAQLPPSSHDGGHNTACAALLPKLAEI